MTFRAASTNIVLDSVFLSLAIFVFELLSCDIGWLGADYTILQRFVNLFKVTSTQTERICKICYARLLGLVQRTSKKIGCYRIRKNIVKKARALGKTWREMAVNRKRWWYLDLVDTLCSQSAEDIC